MCIRDSIQTDGEEKKEKKNLISALFDTMASIVMPMIGPLAGAGMIKAILSLSLIHIYPNPNNSSDHFQ